jgi:predicted metal-binding membrane protein
MTSTASQADGTWQRMLRHEHMPAITALVGITIVCWGYLFFVSQKMAAMGSMHMQFMPWSLTDIALMFVMWWIMMIGMMTPSAMPMILIFTRINQGRRQRSQSFVATTVFAVGYLGIWGVFSLLATVAQWALESTALMMPMAQIVSPLIGGTVLIIAGLYQFTSLKHACLKHCRSPLSFVMNHWRDGAPGALRMGAEHGMYCLGCCWFLMALLFVGGIMNLLWVAILAIYVLAEKLIPSGEWLARLAGLTMLGAGLYQIF